jgi:predicted DCC family thiol-disulfide oxidoreductase YuxK
MTPPLVLYDGVCGFCNRSVQFILRRDPNAIFRFAALQSHFAAEILTRHGANPTDLDAMYAVISPNQPDECLLARSDAIVFILKQLGGVWRPLAAVLQLIPRVVRDAAYRLVARTRYCVFGRYDSCPVPSEDTRFRFLDPAGLQHASKSRLPRNRQ